MARTLDKSRDYGEIWGGDDGVRYVQDGIPFDAQGNAMTDDEPVKRRSPKAKPVADIDAQIEANLAIE